VEARSAPPSVTASRATPLQGIMFIIIGLVEGMYFINLAFGALFVFSLGAK
jgi:F0F1-type ATP synthase membrane subunit c/vacuolar-type H+-ATPase subunit K